MIKPAHRLLEGLTNRADEQSSGDSHMFGSSVVTHVAHISYDHALSVITSHVPESSGIQTSNHKALAPNCNDGEQKFFCEGPCISVASASGAEEVLTRV